MYVGLNPTYIDVHLLRTQPSLQYHKEIINQAATDFLTFNPSWDVITLLDVQFEDGLWKVSEVNILTVFLCIVMSVQTMYWKQKAATDPTKIVLFYDPKAMNLTRFDFITLTR